MVYGQHEPTQAQGHAQVPVTLPICSPGSASIECCQIENSENEDGELMSRDSIQSVQLAYPVLNETHDSEQYSVLPSFIVIPPHIPCDALMLVIWGRGSGQAVQNLENPTPDVVESTRNSLWFRRCVVSTVCTYVGLLAFMLIWFMN